jgi:hypothetical protein
MAVSHPHPATVKPARKPHQPRERTARLLDIGGRLVLTITEWFVRTARATSYHLRPLATDFGTAFELTKFSSAGGEVYHVHPDHQLGDSCDCKGFVAHRHCKHRNCIAELVRRGLLKPAAPAPKPALVQWEDL